jgi:hypothetical protein
MEKVRIIEEIKQRTRPWIYTKRAAGTLWISILMVGAGDWTVGGGESSTADEVADWKLGEYDR